MKQTKQDKINRINRVLRLMNFGNYVVKERKLLGRRTKMESDVLPIIESMRKSHMGFTQIFNILKENGLTTYKRPVCVKAAWNNRKNLKARLAFHKL